MRHHYVTVEKHRHHHTLEELEKLSGATHVYGDKCCDCHYELVGKCPIRPNIGMK